MDIKDDLIQRFLHGQCNEEEAIAVRNYLESHPDQKAQWLGRTEWEEMNGEIDPSFTEEMWRKIDVQTHPVATRNFHFRKLAAAASLVLLAGAGAGILWKMRNNESVDRPAATAITTLPTSTPRTYTNNGDSLLTLALADGSKVALHPHSAITWYERFGQTSRTISLRGRAVFTVSKDKKRPFTVFAEGLTTTALGTVFEVNTLNSKEVGVRLFQGRVVIRSTKFTMKEVYLTAGEAFTYDRYKGSGIVSVKTNEGVPAAAIRRNNSAPELSFTNLPLETVLRNIATEYHVNVEFDAMQLSGKTYSGKFMKSEGAGAVLGRIARSMKLKLKKNKGSYRVY